MLCAAGSPRGVRAHSGQLQFACAAPGRFISARPRAATSAMEENLPLHGKKGNVGSVCVFQLHLIMDGKV